MPILQWLTREEDIGRARRAPYRLLEPVAEHSYGAADTGNMLIQGDNLEALKALLPYYAGRVKCIYIDPPYNTRSAFEHYDDNLEHAKWLEMMYPRLELLWQLLAEDGVILISVNDDEGHYLKVLCDELFGRKNFIATLIWNYEGNTDNQAKIINYHEYILLYAKQGKITSVDVVDPNVGKNSKLHKPEIRNTIVKNGPKNPPSTIDIPPGLPASFDSGTIPARTDGWPKISNEVRVTQGRTIDSFKATSGWSSRNIFEGYIEAGYVAVKDSKGQSTHFEISKNGTIEAVKKREAQKGHFVSVLRGFGTVNQMRILLQGLGLNFTFPKPIGLISYLVSAFTNEQDLVLDSFLGSGTTAHAVLACNLSDNGGRRFIGIEQSQETFEKILIPRMRAVIAGAPTIDLEPHGGGFSAFRVGPAVFDEDGHINSGVRFGALAAHVWFCETGTPHAAKKKSPLLGVHEGTAYYLLYNGILGDRSPDGGNVLTGRVLEELPKHTGPKVIYGEMSRLGPERLKRERITFKQIPYDVTVR